MDKTDVIWWLMCIKSTASAMSKDEKPQNVKYQTVKCKRRIH